MYKHSEDGKRKKNEVFYCWTKPLHLGFTPAAQIRQVAQRLVVRWEGVVHKQSASVEGVIFQLGVVLVVELGGVGAAPLAAILVAQVDDRGAVSRFRHVDETLGHKKKDKKRELAILSEMQLLHPAFIYGRG